MSPHALAEIVVDPEILKRDRYVLRYAPFMLQEVRRHELTAERFLYFLSQGLASGKSPQDWYKELLINGQIAAARRVRSILPRGGGMIFGSQLKEYLEQFRIVCTQKTSILKDRVQRQRSVLEFGLVEDLESLIEEAQALIDEEWFSLAIEGLDEIERLLASELVAASQERRNRFGEAQEQIKSSLKKYIENESVLHLEGTLDVFWELILYAQRLSVESEGDLERVTQICEAVEQLYTREPVDQEVLNELRGMFGWFQGASQDALRIDTPPTRGVMDQDDSVWKPLTNSEETLLYELVGGELPLLSIDLTQGQIPANVRWNERVAKEYVLNVRVRLSQPTHAEVNLPKILDHLRYLLRYWSGRKENTEAGYNDVQECFMTYLELKASYLLSNGYWDAACEYYRMAFRIFSQSNKARNIDRHLYNYFSAYAVQVKSQLYSAAENKPRDRGFNIRLLDALSSSLVDGNEKSAALVAHGLVKLGAENGWWFDLITNELSQYDQGGYDGEKGEFSNLLNGVFSYLAHVLDIKKMPDTIIDRYTLILECQLRSDSDIKELLELLIENTESSSSIMKTVDYVQAIEALPYLWDRTDLQILEIFRKVGNELGRYFTTDLPVQEQQDIAKVILEDRIPSIFHLIEISPTQLGTLYFMRAAENVDTVLTEEISSLVKVSRPILQITVEQSDWRSDGYYYCHLNVSNQGKTHAENVVIWIESPSTYEYEIVDEMKEFGTIAPNKYKAGHVRVKPTPIDEGGNTEFSLRIQVQYNISGQHEPEERFYRLRVDNVSKSPSDFNPIRNPYIVSGRVTDTDMFRGRKEMIKELAAEVADEQRTGSVVIYGQKRAGKTSLLYHLALNMPEFIIPVEFNIPTVLGSLPDLDSNLSNQDLSRLREEAMGRFLYSLALAIMKESEKRHIAVVPITWDQIMEKPGPDVQFQQFLEQFNGRTDGYRLLLLLDEFTRLLDKIDENLIDDAIMQYFKGLIERGYFSCVICGLTEVYEAVKRFANEIAVSKPHLVDYLSRDAARGLIVNPICMPDGSSRFQSMQIVDEIFELTAGSPFYIQIFCHALVRYMNRMHINRVTAADIDEVTNSLINGRSRLDPAQHLDNLYKYKDSIDLDDCDAILEGLVVHLLAHETISKEYASVQAIFKHIKDFVNEDALDKIIHELEQRGTIVRQPDDPHFSKRQGQKISSRHYRIYVDLFRRWIVNNRPIDADVIQSFRRKLINVTAV